MAHDGIGETDDSESHYHAYTKKQKEFWKDFEPHFQRFQKLLKTEKNENWRLGALAFIALFGILEKNNVGMCYPLRYVDYLAGEYLKYYKDNILALSDLLEVLPKTISGDALRCEREAREILKKMSEEKCFGKRPGPFPCCD